MIAIDMKMPKSCVDCPFFVYEGCDGYSCRVLRGIEYHEELKPWKKKRKDCPLVKIPPHGDLIDKRALSKDLQKRWDVNDDQDFCNKEVWYALEEAPTIIPADKEES